MVERRSPKPIVVGSNPTGPAISRLFYEERFIIKTAQKTSRKLAQKTQKRQKPSVDKNFATDIVTEMKRVTWPTKRVVYHGTLLILFIVIFFTIFIGFLDVVLGKVFMALNARF